MIKKIIGKLDRHQLQNPIKHHRSRPLITLSAQATVAEVMRLMARKFEQNSRQIAAEVKDAAASSNVNASTTTTTKYTNH